MIQTNWREIITAPFPPEAVKWRVGRVAGEKALAFSYVNARDVMERFDAAFGGDSWDDRYLTIRDDGGIVAVECSITVRFQVAVRDHDFYNSITKTDVGYSNDPGTDKETEPLKAAYSDAFKRAAVKWGVGRELYETPQFWLPIDDKKRFTVVPVWVDGKGWVIPEGREDQPINALDKRKIKLALQSVGFDREQAIAATRTATGKDSLELLTTKDRDELLRLLADEKFVASIRVFAEDLLPLKESQLAPSNSQSSRSAA